MAQIKTDVQRRVSAVQSEANHMSRMWGLSGDLLAALSKTRVSEDVIGVLEALLQRLLGEMGLLEETFHMCRNLAGYIRDAPVSLKTDELITEVILRLEKCSFDSSELTDFCSLPYLLTRRFPLPLDLKALLPDNSSISDSKLLLMEVRPDHIRIFNCISSTWNKKIVLNTSIRVDHRSSSLFLPNGHLFLCGGLSASEWLQDACEIDVMSGVVTPVKNMTMRRGRLGICLYFNWVYVFGGWNGAPMRSCERYSLLREAWEVVPDMISARDSFTPAVYRHVAYLCGGSNTVECESYDFACSKFSPLGVNLPEPGFIRSVVFGTDLLLLSDTKMTRRSLAVEGVSQDLSHPSYRANGSMSPVTFNTDIWCLSYSSNGTALCISAGTGELLREVPYPN